jgi:hypothetical protein
MTFRVARSYVPKDRSWIDLNAWGGVAMACGVMLGIALWYVLPSLLPSGAGDWLASSLIGGGQWRAGET